MQILGSQEQPNPGTQEPRDHPAQGEGPQPATLDNKPSYEDSCTPNSDAPFLGPDSDITAPRVLTLVEKAAQSCARQSGYHDWEDVQQTILMRLWIRRNSGKAIQYESYIWHMAENLLIDKWRRESRRGQRVPLESVDGSAS